MTKEGGWFLWKPNENSPMGDWRTYYVTVREGRYVYRNGGNVLASPEGGYWAYWVESEELSPVVRLTAYEWHALLSELERAQSVVNRDTTHATQLWERISKQLNMETI